MQRASQVRMREVANLISLDGTSYAPVKSRSKRPDLIGTIYFIGPREGMVKIGFTNDLPTRLKRLQCGSPVPLFVLAAIHDKPASLEREYHARFRSARQHGEWFLRTIDINAEIECLLNHKDTHHAD